MNGYLMHFVAYTFAMVGFIVMVMFVYKKAMYSSPSSKNKEFLAIENSLRLSATKTVYVIKAGKEKFLIAGDSANTTMLAKLNSDNIPVQKENLENQVSELSSVRKHIQRISRG
jgi:flagellar biogenesis protein FliO